MGQARVVGGGDISAREEEVIHSVDICLTNDTTTKTTIIGRRERPDMFTGVAEEFPCPL